MKQYCNNVRTIWLIKFKGSFKPLQQLNSLETDIIKKGTKVKNVFLNRMWN